MPEEWVEELTDLLKVVRDCEDLDFLEIIKGDLQIRLGRANNVGSQFNAPPENIAGHTEPGDPPVSQVTSITPSQDPSPASKAHSTSAESREGTVLIDSPMVGTFYTASEPGAPPFVEVGQTITADTTLALIEAMKVFTAVRAQVAGVVEEILVENGQFVEFDQPLFRVGLD